MPPDLRLTWPYLFAHAHALAPASLRLAFLLAVVGYGTKVGLAPMHTWLPDAHAEAPSPASAMLSAALLNTGMYAIIRFLAIARAGLGDGFPRGVLLVFGFLSIVIGVLFMVRRGNFKRLFAYSSVEHMGIIAVALGFGGVLGLYGALLQTLNHAIAKAVLFLTSGDVALRYRTREAAGVRGLLAAVPLTGGALLLGSFAVLGSPPFGLFLSEFTIVRAGFAAPARCFPLLLLALLAVAFVAFARTTTGMATGPAGEPAVTGPDLAGPAEISTGPPPSPYRGRAAGLTAVAPLAVGLAALLILGLWIPGGPEHGDPALRGGAVVTAVRPELAERPAWRNCWASSARTRRPVTGRSSRSGVAAADLRPRFDRIAAHPGARLADVFASGVNPAANGDPVILRLVWALDADRRYLITESAIDGDRYPSLSDIAPAAFAEECEIYEQFGIRPSGGKPLNRVAMPPWAGPDLPRLGRAPAEPPENVHAPHVVGGQAFEFPFGPVRQVGVESLYYGLVTSGEELVDLYLFTWHKHRGVEWRLRGQTPQEALFQVERAEGLGAVGNGWAFAAAAEAALGIEPPAGRQRPGRSRSSWSGCTTTPPPWRRCARPAAWPSARPPRR